MKVLTELEMYHRFNKYYHLLKPIQRIKCPFVVKQVLIYEHKLFVSLGTNEQEYYLKLYLITLIELINYKTQKAKKSKNEN
ncbi:hypothetical protein BvCmsB5655_03606 [Escherichia coli]|nr:hypothetical protein BvCmsB5655_03606 [Escherichia coli]